MAGIVLQGIGEAKYEEVSPPDVLLEAPVRIFAETNIETAQRILKHVNRVELSRLHAAFGGSTPLG